MEKVVIALLFAIILSSVAFAGGGGILISYDYTDIDYYEEHLKMLDINVNDEYNYTVYTDGEIYYSDSSNPTSIKKNTLSRDDAKFVNDSFGDAFLYHPNNTQDGNTYKIVYYCADNELVCGTYYDLSTDYKDALYLVFNKCISEGEEIPFTVNKRKPIIYEGKELREVTLVLNGIRFVPNDNQMPAVILDDRTLVPVREVFEKLGGVVEWDNYSKKASISFGDKTIELTIDSLTAKVNGKDVSLDVPAKIINSKTMVPVRFVSEQGGLNVEWNDATRTVSINKIVVTSLATVKYTEVEASTYLSTSIEKDKIKEITFSNSIAGHSVDNEKCFDVSDDSSGSVLLWINNIDNKGMCSITIGQANKVIANEDSSNLFYKLTNLEKINNIEYLDTSKAINMYQMFCNCKSLKELNLKSFNTANVSNMGKMFSGCESLKSLDLSSINTKRVTKMQGMFESCSSLEKINLLNFDTDIVIEMNDMFSGCSSLKELDLSSFKRASKIDNMFKNDSNLQTIYVSGGFALGDIVDSKGRVPNGSDVFLGCTKLVGGSGTKYNSKNIDYEYARIDGGVSNPGYFSYKTGVGVTYPIYGTIYDVTPSSSQEKEYELHFNLTRNTISGLNAVNTITITENSHYAINTSIWGSYADRIITVVFDEVVRPSNTDSWFYGCKNLTKISNIENLDTSLATSMKYMFRNCSSLTQIDLSHFNTSNVTDMGMMFHGCASLTSIDVSSFDTSKVTNMEYLFSGCNKLTSLDVSNFDTSNVTSMKFMMSYFKVLTSLDLSNFNTSKVEDMSHMFYWCDNLETIKLSNFDTKNVKNMSSMFGACYALKELDLRKFDTSNVTDMNFMFSGCKKISKLDLSSFNTSNVTNMHAMFQECNELTELNVSSFDTSKVLNMSCMFNQCHKLTVLDISSFNTSNTVDMGQMFGYCYYLKTIYVSETFVTTNLQYGKSSSMFVYDANLVGGSGTKFDSKVTDGWYAYIDEGPSRPGYFSKK